MLFRSNVYERLDAHKLYYIWVVVGVRSFIDPALPCARTIGVTSTAVLETEDMASRLWSYLGFLSQSRITGILLTFRIHAAHLHVSADPVFDVWMIQ